MRVIKEDDVAAARGWRIAPSGTTPRFVAQPGDRDHRSVPLTAASTEMPFSVRMLPMARWSAARALT